jgi:purine-nucleoside phosphorylase
MVISDHINLAWRNPLVGRVEPGEDRFPDMSDPWDRELRALLHRAARDVGVAVEDGVYAWLSGPSYETPAEVRMLHRFGADATGMSTVPEVLVARALGMTVAGMSCITNMAAGISGQRIHHAEVLEVTAAAARRFEAVVERWVGLLPT